MALTITYIGQATSASNLTIYDFGSFSIPRDGLVVVGAVARNSGDAARTISSVSIGGTNGTIIANNGSVANPVGFAARAVTAGSHNVTVTFSGGEDRAGCAVYLVEGYNSATPYDTDAVYNASSNTASLTFDAPSLGKAIFAHVHGNSQATTWSAATEDYDATTEVQMSFANRVPTAGTGVSETISWTSATTNGSAVVVFQPAAIVSPTITSPTSYSHPEETSLVGTVTATGDAPITFSISGGDSSLFTINSSTGELRFKALPDYDNPADSGGNNVYNFDLTASNGGTDDVEAITVTVTDTDKTGLLRPENATSAAIYARYDCSNAATFGGSFPANGATVTSLTEISTGSGPNFTGSGTNTFVANATNGIGCIRLSDSGGNFTATWGSSFSEFSIFLVLKPRQDAESSPMLFDQTASLHLITGFSRSGGRTINNWARNRDTEWCVFCRTKTADSAASGGNLPGRSRLSFNGQCFAGQNGDAGAALTSGNTVKLGGTFASQPDIAELIVMDADVSYVEEVQIRRYLMRKWGIEDHERLALVTLGNSITTGDETCYPTEVTIDLYSEEGRDFELHNLGQTGGTVATLANQATQIAALLADINARDMKAVLCLWHGHNNSLWSAGVQSDIETIPAPWRSAGHRAISINMSPVGTSAPGTNANEYLDNHTWHEDHGLEFVDVVADTTEVSWMADIDAWVADSTHRKPDGLHLLELGNQEVGDWMKPKILGQFEAMEAATGGSNYTTGIGLRLGIGL